MVSCFWLLCVCVCHLFCFIASDVLAGICITGMPFGLNGCLAVVVARWVGLVELIVCLIDCLFGWLVGGERLSLLAL